MTFDKDELFRLGIQTKIAELTTQIAELKTMLRRHRSTAATKDDQPKKKKKMTPAQYANLKKAWAARAAQAKATREGKAKE